MTIFPMYFVYVLKSQTNNRYYTGSTDNVERRLTQHNAGRSKATKSSRPFILVRTEIFETRTEAVRRELFLKSGHGRDELRQLLND